MARKIRQIQRENRKDERDECMIAYYNKLIKENRDVLNTMRNPYMWLYTKVAGPFFISPRGAMNIIREKIGEISEPRNFDKELEILEGLLNERVKEGDNEG